MDNNDALAIALANRCFMYRYLWRAFALEPDEAFLESVQDDQTAQAIRIHCGDESRAFKAHEMILDFLEGEKDSLARLNDEYVRLFIGPSSLPSPPWESAFVDGEGLLFQKSTLEVRRFYASAGYKTAGTEHIADDHIAIELDFMCHLAESSMRSFEAGDDAAVKESLSRQFRFLAEHLNVWLKQFAERLNENASPKISCVYPCFAVLVQEACRVDEKALAELIPACEG